VPTIRDPEVIEWVKEVRPYSDDAMIETFFFLFLEKGKKETDVDDFKHFVANWSSMPRSVRVQPRAREPLVASQVMVARQAPGPALPDNAAGNARNRSQTCPVPPPQAKPMVQYSDDRGSILGGGAFSTVYKGVYTKGPLEVDCAVKIVELRYPGLGEAEAKRIKNRLLREKDALKMVSHPNVIALLRSAVRAEARMELVLEYMRGGTLGDWIDDRGGQPINSAIAVEIEVSILSGLVALHTAQVVHRDIKPDNIMFDKPLKRDATSLGRVVVKIADLGLAVFDPRQTQLGAGSHGYMPPEQQCDAQSGSIDGRVDVFACGVIFHQLVLDGRLPWSDLSPHALLQEMRKEAYVPVLMRADPPHRVLLTRMLRAQPSDRPHARECLSSLLGNNARPAREQIGPPPSVFLHRLSYAEASSIRIGAGKHGKVETTFWKVMVGGRLLQQGTVSPQVGVGNLQPTDWHTAVFGPPPGANWMRWLYACPGNTSLEGVSPGLQQLARHGGVVFFRNRDSEAPMAAGVALTQKERWPEEDSAGTDGAFELRFGEPREWGAQFNRRLIGPYGHSAAERIQQVPAGWWGAGGIKPMLYAVVLPGEHVDSPSTSESLTPLSWTGAFVFWYYKPVHGRSDRLFDEGTRAYYCPLMPPRDGDKLSGEKLMRRLVQLEEERMASADTMPNLREVEPDLYGRLQIRLSALNDLPLETLPPMPAGKEEVCRRLKLRTDTCLNEDTMETVRRKWKSAQSRDLDQVLVRWVASGLCMQAENAVMAVGPEHWKEVFPADTAHELLDLALVATFDAIGTVGSLTPVDTFAQLLLKEVLEHPMLTYLHRCSMQSLSKRDLPSSRKGLSSERQMDLKKLKRTPVGLPDADLAREVWTHREAYLGREESRDFRTRELMLRCGLVVYSGVQQCRLVYDASASIGEHAAELSSVFNDLRLEKETEPAEDTVDVFLALLAPRYTSAGMEVTWKVAAEWLRRAPTSLQRYLIPQIVASLRSAQSTQCAGEGEGPWRLLDVVADALVSGNHNDGAAGSNESLGVEKWACLSDLWWALTTEFIAEQTDRAAETWARVTCRRVTSHMDILSREQILSSDPAELKGALTQLGVSETEQEDFVRVEEERSKVSAPGLYFQALMRLTQRLDLLQKARISKQQCLVWLLDRLSAKLRDGADPATAKVSFEIGVRRLVAGGQTMCCHLEDTPDASPLCGEEEDEDGFIDVIGTRAYQDGMLTRMRSDRSCPMETSEKAHLTLPLDPTKLVVGVVEGQIKVFDSACRPFKVEFKTEGDTQPCRVMYKRGDDLRRDQVVLQVIEQVDKLFKKRNMTLGLTPYKVVPTSNSSGMLQFIGGSEPLQKHVFEGGTLLSKELPEMARQKRNGELSHEKCQLLNNWIHSNAAYAVLTFFLGVGDRHLENLMIERDELRLFHIDFGFILGKDPKMRIDVKLRSEMKNAMGDHFEQDRFLMTCAAIYLGIRCHASELLGLLNAVSMVQCTNKDGTSEYMLTSDAELEATERAIRHAQERLKLGMEDAAAIDFIRNIVEDSGTGATGLVDRLSDYIHYVLHS